LNRHYLINKLLEIAEYLLSHQGISEADLSQVDFKIAKLQLIAEFEHFEDVYEFGILLSRWTYDWDIRKKDQKYSEQLEGQIRKSILNFKQEN
jgi:hypothetical protein